MEYVQGAICIQPRSTALVIPAQAGTHPLRGVRAIALWDLEA